MTDIIVAVFVISGFIGIKKPIYGAIAGAIVAPLIYYFFHTFDLIYFIVLFPIGFIIGWISGSLSKWFFSGFRGGKHNTGPSYTGRAGGHQRGGIVFTDEEMKNVQNNKKRVE